MHLYTHIDLCWNIYQKNVSTIFDFLGYFSCLKLYFLPFSVATQRQALGVAQTAGDLLAAISMSIFKGGQRPDLDDYEGIRPNTQLVGLAVSPLPMAK